MDKLAEIRREYGNRELRKSTIAPNPVDQLKIWVDEAIAAQCKDATAMVLATTDTQGYPDTRVVLLKAIEDGKLIFYTNRTSFKAQQIKYNPAVGINFYWGALARQIRVQGNAELLSDEISCHYFASRPRNSQIAAYASPQSKVIENREALITLYANIEKKYANKNIPCPQTWCGFAITPLQFEFFQGRDSRLHDRICYRKQNDEWEIKRLAP